jgi:hypothetical protein
MSLRLSCGGGALNSIGISDKIKIGVVGLGPGAGAGFISVMVAMALAEERNLRPAVVEICHKSRLYDSLALDKHFAGREYNCFFKDISEGKSIRGKSNLLHGVNWALKSPSEQDIVLDYINVSRFVNQVRGDMVICKISGIYGDDLQDILGDMDKILAIIDPLPSKMLSNYNLLCQLRTLDNEVVYVINKMNEGVSKRELCRYLQVKNPVYFPMLDHTLIYSSEYSCRFLFNKNQAKSMVLKPTYDILAAMLSGIC